MPSHTPGQQVDQEVVNNVVNAASPVVKGQTAPRPRPSSNPAQDISQAESAEPQASSKERTNSINDLMKYFQQRDASSDKAKAKKKEDDEAKKAEEREKEKLKKALKTLEQVAPNDPLWQWFVGMIESVAETGKELGHAVMYYGSSALLKMNCFSKEGEDGLKAIKSASYNFLLQKDDSLLALKQAKDFIINAFGQFLESKQAKQAENKGKQAGEEAATGLPNPAELADALNSVNPEQTQAGVSPDAEAAAAGNSEHAAVSARGAVDRLAANLRPVPQPNGSAARDEEEHTAAARAVAGA